MTGHALPHDRPSRHLRASAALAALPLLLAGCPAEDPPAEAQSAASPRVGPSRGTLMAAGGGRLPQEIWQRFVELAGGPEARIVLIPTAGTRNEYGDDWDGDGPLRLAGAQRLSVLHTRDRQEASSDAFLAPLREATGVWITGGRQWRLVDAYLHTRTHDEIRKVLERGGVVAGTSAGASILASYLVRGAPEGNHIMMAPGYEEGFGFLRGTAVDQHLLTRERERDLLQVLRVRPELLGLGLDEGTALVVQGDRAEVLGRSRVAVYDATAEPGEPFWFLHPGDVLDLASRRTVREAAGAAPR